MGTPSLSYFNNVFTETNETSLEQDSEFLYILPELPELPELHELPELSETSEISEISEPYNIYETQESSVVYKLKRKNRCIDKEKKDSNYYIRRKKNTECARRRRNKLRQELIEFKEHIKIVARMNIHLLKTVNLLKYQRRKLLSKFI